MKPKNGCVCVREGRRRKGRGEEVAVGGLQWTPSAFGGRGESKIGNLENMVRGCRRDRFAPTIRRAGSFASQLVGKKPKNACDEGGGGGYRAQ